MQTDSTIQPVASEVREVLVHGQMLIAGFWDEHENWKSKRTLGGLSEPPCIIKVGAMHSLHIHHTQSCPTHTTPHQCQRYYLLVRQQVTISPNFEVLGCQALGSQ